MKAMCIRSLAIVLVMALSLLLFGCDGQSEEGNYQGIHISEEVPYSADAMAYAEETLYSLLLHYTKKSGLQTIPDATLTRLEIISRDVAGILAQKPVQESIYLLAMDELRAHGALVVDEWLEASENGSTDYFETRTLYLSLVSLLGQQTLSQMLYPLVLYAYDCQYQNAMEKSEKYPQYQQMYENRAKETLQERTIFVEGIGEDGFSQVFSQMIAFSDLLLGEGFIKEDVATFTNEEILIFLEALQLSKTQISDAGWSLILEKVFPRSGGESYMSHILAKMRNNGDTQQLATIMNDVCNLLVSLCEQLTEGDIALLRVGEDEKVICNLLKRLGEDAFASLSRIGAASLCQEDYDAIASSFYGEAYHLYRDTMVSMTADEFKSSLEETTFYESLERYIAGISPALSYGMRQ